MENNYLLEKNHSRIYLGKVVKVQRDEYEPVRDFIGNNLEPKQILFNVGNIIKEAKASPLELSNEVNEGDVVIIFSLEILFNNTYYYSPVRKLSKDNGTLYMKYGDSEIRFIPKDERNTDLKIAGGRSVLSFNTEEGSVRLDSDSGGIGINSGEGYIDIRNNEISLEELLSTILNNILELKVLTSEGPASLTPDSSLKFSKSLIDVSKLFSSVETSYLYPNIPEDTYSANFAFDAVNSTGIHFLNDEGVSNLSSSISSLQSKFSNNYPPISSQPLVSSVTPKIISEVTSQDIAKYSNKEDVQLTTNFYLSDVSTKATWPHRLKAQKGLSKDQLVSNLQNVALNILEPLRSKYPDMIINSGFRGTPSIPGGTSQHELGQAVDLQFPSFSFEDYFHAAEWVMNNVCFDQFIFEHGNKIWFHLSLKNGSPQRRRAMTMIRGRYESGIKLYYNT